MFRSCLRLSVGFAVTSFPIVGHVVGAEALKLAFGEGVILSAVGAASL